MPANYIVGLTREQLKECLKGFWCMKWPEAFLCDGADYCDDDLKPESHLTKDEMADVIMDNPEFIEFVNKLILKIVSGKNYDSLDNDDVLRFGRKSVCKVSKYNTRREIVKGIVKEAKKREEEKITKSQIRNAKRILKKAGIK